MSGCHTPNACHHVDGEFCARCYTPKTDKKPTLGLFGNETQNLIFQNILNRIDSRIDNIHQILENTQIIYDEKMCRLSRRTLELEKFVKEWKEMPKFDLKEYLYKVNEHEKLIERLYGLKKVNEHESVNPYEAVNSQYWHDQATKFKEKSIHLEGCLEYKNKMIKNLEDALSQHKKDIGAAMINDRMSRSENTKLRANIESLLDQLKTSQSGKKCEIVNSADAGAGGGGGSNHYEINKGPCL